MRNGVFILAAAGMAGVVAGVPAGGQEPSSNPLDVTWQVDAPYLVKPLPFALNDQDPLAAALPFRVSLRGVALGPSAAAPVEDFNSGAHLQPGCLDETVCADGEQGRLGLRLRSDGSGGVKLGALVSLGEDLSRPRSLGDNSWRFFAAADAHALTWDFDRSDGDSVRLEDDKVLVGDAQVGIARPLAGGDLAFGYIHREVSVEGASRTEQFGGVTFSLSH